MVDNAVKESIKDISVGGDGEVETQVDTQTEKNIPNEDLKQTLDDDDEYNFFMIFLYIPMILLSLLRLFLAFLIFISCLYKVPSYPFILNKESNFFMGYEWVMTKSFGQLGTFEMSIRNIVNIVLGFVMLMSLIKLIRKYIHKIKDV